MLVVDSKTGIICNATKCDALVEFAMLANALVDKGVLEKKDIEFAVEVACLSTEELKERAKAIVKNDTNDSLKKLLKEMLDELE